MNNEKRMGIPSIIIGVVGHVDHGKTTLVQALTGIWTAKYSEELKRSMTIRLGYAQGSVLYCEGVEPPSSYIMHVDSCPHGVEPKLLKTVSFVDAPGHEILMATMLSGASLMDAAILVVAANEPCPQPQTIEHAKALEILGVEQVMVVQNKIDVVPLEKVQENYKQIREFLKATKYSKAPVIPVSALHRVNADAVAMAIARLFREPERDLGKPAIMQIARSFDVNLPGTPPEKLVGGVVGGALMKGEIKVGDEVEIKPGVRIVSKGRVTYEPLTTEITSIRYGEIESSVARPGGLVALRTKLDPSLTKGDALRGQVLGHSVPDAVQDIRVEYRMLDKVVGAREAIQPPKPKVKDVITLIIGTRYVNAVIESVTRDVFEAKLSEPTVVLNKSRVAILMKIGGRLRLVGWGVQL